MLRVICGEERKITRSVGVMRASSFQAENQEMLCVGLGIGQFVTCGKPKLGAQV